VRIALIIFLAGCATTKPTIVEKVVTVPVKIPCVTEPAPTYVPVPRPRICSPGVLCLDKKDAIALSENVEKMKSWIARIVTLCGQ